MTKLGFHVASNSRNGAGDLLVAGAAYVALVDTNMISEVRQKAPGAVVSFRTRKGPGEDNPVGIDHEPLERIPQRAREWMDAIKPTWDKNPGADYYLPNNEWDIGTIGSGLCINSFALTCMQIAESWGKKLGILNFASGNPSDDEVAGLPMSMEDRLVTVLPAMRYAAEHGHAISLHSHALQFGSLQASGEHIALRFQRLLRYCKMNGFLPNVLISELSNGVGGVEPNLGKFILEVGWWDAAVQASPFANQVLGGALYGFNAAETIAPAVKSLVRLMGRSVPLPLPVDPPVSFSGSVPQSKYDQVVAAITAAGGSVTKS